MVVIVVTVVVSVFGFVSTPDPTRSRIQLL